jgi:hypothetical protein
VTSAVPEEVEYDNVQEPFAQLRLPIVQIHSFTSLSGRMQSVRVYSILYHRVLKKSMPNFGFLRILLFSVFGLNLRLKSLSIVCFRGLAG